jgi:hypothetical protein
MSDIRHIGPAFPVRPPRPAGERESGRRNRQPADPRPAPAPDELPDDPAADETKPTIDEYI